MRKNILLIEDDPYRDLCYDNVDLTPISTLIKTSALAVHGEFF